MYTIQVGTTKKIIEIILEKEVNLQGLVKNVSFGLEGRVSE